MRRFLILNYFIFQLCILNTGMAQEDRTLYTLAMPEPYTHNFDVSVTVSPVSGEYTDFKIPAWAPGSYLVRDFAKNISDVSAFTPDGDTLKLYKTDKQTWRVLNGKTKSITIKYKVYAFTMSVRTSYLDDQEGYVNGTSVFMYTDQAAGRPVRLDINPYPGWEKISTGLAQDTSNPNRFYADNYDQLVDCPIEIGNQVTFDFTSHGILHEVAMAGPGNYDISRLKSDMMKITSACIDMFGINENKKYVFIVHNVEQGDGGLEHTNSVSLSVNRWIYEPRGSYIGFLGLVTHEYIHQWIVKRIRPSSLVHYNYESENYTDLLWMMEGFPSYYDDVMLSRLGYISDTDYINRFTGAINSVENMPGNEVSSVAEASFNAWIKQYQPDENFINSSVSYYTKGNVLGALLDLQVIHATMGKQDLHDVIRYLYDEYYRKNFTGINETIIKKAFEKFIGHSMDDFFNRYVDGTASIDYKKYLGFAGLIVVNLNNGEGPPFAGIGMRDRDGKTIVQTVYANSAAQKAGIAPEDEIIGLDGFRVNTSRFQDYIKSKNPGDTVNVLLSREGILYNKNIILEKDNRKQYSIFVNPGATPLQKTVYNKWLLGK